MFPEFHMFPEYELKVRYPLDGVRLILQWSSREEGNHIILAKTKAAVENTFKHVLSEHTFAEVEKFIAAKIVSPPDWLKEKFAQACFDDECLGFWSVWSECARRYYTKNKKLPAKLIECPQFNPHDDENVAEDALTYHYDCETCNGFKILPKEGTHASVFIQNRDAWKQSAKRKQIEILGKMAAAESSKENLFAPTGEPADLNKKLFAALPKFGHHMAGIRLDEVHKDFQTAREYLFFYQEIEDIDMEVVKSLQDESVRKMENWRAQKIAEAEQRRKEREQSEFADFLSIFG